MCYVIELRGRGVLPYEFATKSEAESYLLASFNTLQYRIHRVKRGALVK